MYSNVHVFLNKDDELLSIIEKDKPLIITLTGTEKKCNVILLQLNIVFFDNHRMKVGVDIYVDINLNTKLSSI